MPPSPPSQTEVAQAKRKGDSADERPAKRPKTEPGAAQADLGVIELSDDDEDLDVLQVRFFVTLDDGPRDLQRLTVFDLSRVVSGNSRGRSSELRGRRESLLLGPSRRNLGPLNRALSTIQTMSST